MLYSGSLEFCTSFLQMRLSYFFQSSFTVSKLLEKLVSLKTVDSFHPRNWTLCFVFLAHKRSNCSNFSNLFSDSFLSIESCNCQTVWKFADPHRFYTKFHLSTIIDILINAYKIKFSKLKQVFSFHCYPFGYASSPTVPETSSLKDFQTGVLMSGILKFIYHDPYA